MHAHQHLNLALLAAPDEGFPGIPGAGPSKGGSGLPGIPGGGPSGIPGSGSSPSPAPQPAAQPTPSQGWGAPAPTPGDAGAGGGGGHPGQPQFARPEPQHASGGGGEVFELAGWGSRFAAWLVDWLIIVLLSIPVILIADALGIDTGSSSAGDGRATFSVADGQTLVLMMIYIIVAIFYAPTTMMRLQGSTVGKRLLGIRVVRADGLPLNFAYAFVREIVLKGIVVQSVSFVTIGLAGLINYLWPLWDSENRAIHDIAAKSRVVRR